jgi:glycosidase
MSFARIFSCALAMAGVLMAAAAVPACGDSDAHNRDFGQPPDAAIFNPGNGGGSDPYGYGEEQPFVCPDELKACTHTFTYPDSGQSTVELRGDFGGPETWDRGAAMARKGGAWSVDVKVPYGKPVQYKFLVNGTEWTTDPAQPTVTDANQNTNNTFAGKTCDPALCEEEGQLPPGVYDWRDSVIYFVFVDRFLRGRAQPNACTIDGVAPIANYQGGDWQGVTKKIDEGYFNDLGADTLWVTVPFDNPQVAGAGVGGDTNLYSAYHGYWPKIDSDNPAQLAYENCFGTEADFKAMVSAAHQKGIKILIDYAMVHVHDSSAIVAQHSDWFWPNDNGQGGNCICGQGCSWDALPDRERCWFTGYLPHWNYTNSAAREYSVDNAIEWVKQTGVDGFRADAVKHIDMSWLTALRAKVKSEITATQTPPQRFYMVGETYDFGNRDVLKEYVDPSTKLDGQFDFPLRKHIVDAVIMKHVGMNDLASFMNGNDYFYGASAIMSTWIGNHDLPRIIHLAANNRIFGDDQGADGKGRAWSNQPGAVTEIEAFERVANGFAVILTNRGAPLIYYGDEIGLPGAGDPDNRRFMQWSNLNASQRFLKERIAKLTDIRSKHPALRRGTRTTLEVSADLWAYSRVTTGDEVFVVINRADAPRDVNALPSAPLTELITGDSVSGPRASIPARQTRIFVRK